VDIERVNVVVNFDLPAMQQPQYSGSANPDHAAVHTYFHRAGRTGRFGTLGVVISLFDKKNTNDVAFLNALEAFKHQPIQRVDFAKGERIPAKLYACTLETRAEQEALSSFKTAREMVVRSTPNTDSHDADAQSLGSLLKDIGEEASRPAEEDEKEAEQPPPRRRQRRSQATASDVAPQYSEPSVNCMIPPFYPQIPWHLL